MPFAVQVSESWVRLGTAVVAVLAGILALSVLTRALRRTPSAAGWLLARLGFVIVAVGLLMRTGVIPHEPAFPAERLDLAVGALVGGGLAFLLIGRVLTSQAARTRQGVRIAAPVTTVAPAKDVIMTLPPGGQTKRRAAKSAAIGIGSR